MIEKENIEEEEDFIIHIQVRKQKVQSWQVRKTGKKFKNVFYTKPHGQNCDRALEKRGFKRGNRYTATSKCWSDFVK